MLEARHMRTVQELIKAANEAYERFDLETAEAVASEFEALGTTEGRCRSALTFAYLAFYRGELQRSHDLYEQAHQIAVEMNDAALIAKSLSGIGIALHRLGALQRAYEFHLRSLEAFEAIGSRSGIAVQYHNIGLSLESLGDLSGAVPWVRKAIDLYTELNDTARMANATSLLGSIYCDCGQISEGTTLLYRALDQFEQIGNRHKAAQIIANIGSVYHDLKRDEEALALYERSYTMFTELGVLADAGNVLASMGSTLYELGRTAEARESLERSISILEACNDGSALSWSYEKLARQHVSNNDLDAARALIASTQPWDDMPPILHREWLLTHAELKMCEAAYDDAKELMERALELTIRSGATTHVAEIHMMLRDLAQQRNDFAGYIHHNTEYLRLNEEVRGAQATQRIAILEADRSFERERQEHEKQRAVLYSTLPQHIADRVSRGEQVNDHYDNAAVIFLDIVGFTKISEQLSSQQVVQFLDTVFTTLDAICKKHEVVKIKTIGDSYMAVALPEQPNNRIAEQPNGSCVHRAANAALEMLDAVSQISLPNGSPEGSPERSHVSVRIGLHVGAVTAGVLGKERLQYDVWGDTVNVASRMESTGEPGRIHVSEMFASLLSPSPFLASARNDSSSYAEGKEGSVIPSVSEEQNMGSQFPVPWSLRERGALEVKGKGLMTTYWLLSSR